MQACIEIDYRALPLLEGAAESLEAGIVSTLHVQNARVSSLIHNFDEVSGNSGGGRGWA